MKNSFSQQATYWLGVIAVGLVIGLGIQSASAWTNPTATPPNSNVPGPLTTGDSGQTKTGNLILNTSGTNYYGLSANGFVQGISGLCMGPDCRTSWADAVKGGTDVYYAAGDFFTINCDKNGHWAPRADCPVGTRPVSCLLDIKDNGKMEDGDEYYGTMHDVHGTGSQTGYGWNWWGNGTGSSCAWGICNSDVISRFTLNLVPPGSKGEGLYATNPSRKVAQNGACQMWYTCDPTDYVNGGVIRTRAVCMPAGSNTIQNPNTSGSGALKNTNP